MDSKYDIYRQSLLELSKDPSFILNGNEDTLNGVSLNELMNLDFTKDNVADELVSVHATDYFPNNNEIICTALGGRYNSIVNFRPNNYVQASKSHRYSVHSTLNFKVKSHAAGNWDNKKFTILTPFNKVSSNIWNVVPYDTFFEDRINLGEDSIILIHESEKEKLDLSNINAKVIYYSGDLDLAISKAQIMMGYKPQIPSNNPNYPSFTNMNNLNRVSELSHKYQSGPHEDTLYPIIERTGIIKDTILSNARGKTHLEKNTMLPNTEVDEVLINEIDSREVETITYEELMLLYNNYSDQKTKSKYDMMTFFIVYGIDLSNPNEIRLYNDKEILDNWLTLTKGDKSPSFLMTYYSIQYGMLDKASIEKLESYYNNYLILEENNIRKQQEEVSKLAMQKPISELTENEWLLVELDDEYNKTKAAIESKIPSQSIDIQVKRDRVFISNSDENETIFTPTIFNKENQIANEVIDSLTIRFDTSKNIQYNLEMIDKEIEEVITYLNSKNTKNTL